MQEDIENRTVILAVSAAKITYTVIAHAMHDFMEDARQSGHRKFKYERADIGEVNRKLSDVGVKELYEGNVNLFDRYARECGVSYRVKQQTENGSRRYYIIYSSGDELSILKAFKRYSDDIIRMEREASERGIDRSSPAERIGRKKEKLAWKKLQKAKKKELVPER